MGIYSLVGKDANQRTLGWEGMQAGRDMGWGYGLVGESYCWMGNMLRVWRLGGI